MANVEKDLKRYCVFNKTRESFVSLSVVAADTHLARLKGLLGRLRLKSDGGIWVIPSQGVHTIGVLFAIDVIYLDEDYRVLHLIESFGTFRIGPIRGQCTSVLELPTRTIYSSQTQVGDELLICSPEEMEQYLQEKASKPAERSVARGSSMASAERDGNPKLAEVRNLGEGGEVPGTEGHRVLLGRWGAEGTARPRY